MESARSASRICRLCGALLLGSSTECWFCHRSLGAAEILVNEKKPFFGTGVRPTVQFPLPAVTSTPSSSLQEHGSGPFGTVYLLKSGRYYKIGKSKDFDSRLDQIKLQLPFRVEVVHTIETEDPDGIELYWHKRFEAKRKNGEWFVLSEADLEVFLSRSKM